MAWFQACRASAGAAPRLHVIKGAECRGPLDTILLQYGIQSSLAECADRSCHSKDEWFAGCRRGDTFDRQRHESGTEVKAITYSAMQINEKEGDAELFVIVDI